MYVENEKAEEILISAGKKPYSGFEWQLVQTHLLSPSGELKELWRPGKDSGPEAAQELLQLLDNEIQTRNLKKGDVLAPYQNPRVLSLSDNELLLQVVLRVPVQENYPHDSTTSVDWIVLTEDQAKFFRDAIHSPQSVPLSLAADMLVHFRAPLDKAEDPKEDALVKKVIRCPVINS